MTSLLQLNSEEYSNQRGDIPLDQGTYLLSELWETVLCIFLSEFTWDNIVFGDNRTNPKGFSRNSTLESEINPVSEINPQMILDETTKLFFVNSLSAEIISRWFLREWKIRRWQDISGDGIISLGYKASDKEIVLAYFSNLPNLKSQGIYVSWERDDPMSADYEKWYRIRIQESCDSFNLDFCYEEYVYSCPDTAEPVDRRFYVENGKFGQLFKYSASVEKWVNDFLEEGDDGCVYLTPKVLVHLLHIPCHITKETIEQYKLLMTGHDHDIFYNGVES